MRTIQGPSLFLAQFVQNQPPSESVRKLEMDTLDGLARWAASLGYVAVQLPTWLPQLFDLAQAAASPAYCDDLRARLAKHGLVVSELSTHLQGQLVAVHPAYDLLFDAFAPVALHGRPAERQRWAVAQLQLAARASRNLGLTAHASFSGSLAWPYVYPWPQRPAGLIEEAFAELARRWLPILDAFDHSGVDLCFELHPGEDLHDGVTFERFLAAVGDHPRAAILFDPSHMLLQQMDPARFLDHYHSRVRAFHVKDAEFQPNGRSGVYGGYQSWIDRPGRFRTPGSGQVDFPSIFARLAQYDYPGWAVLEWEDPIESAAEGARKGADFIRQQIVHVTDRAFDDFAGSAPDPARNRRILGL